MNDFYPTCHVGRTRPRGMAMLLVLVAIAIAFIMGLSFLQAQTTTTGIARNIDRHARARHIAEGGLQLALAEVRLNSDWRTDYAHGQWLADQPLAGGTFTIRGEDEIDGDLANDATQPFTLIATGRFDGVSHVVQMQVVPGVSNRISGIVAATKIEMKGSTRIDSFESAQGAYGGGNIGSAAQVSTNATAKDKLLVSDSSQLRGDALVGPAGNVNQVVKVGNSATLTGSKLNLAAAVPIPSLQEPADMGASVGDRNYSSGTTTISSNLHCNKLIVSGAAILEISGNVTILAEGDVEFKNTAQIRIAAGSTLRLHTKRKFKVKDDALVNVDSGDPRRLEIFHLSAEDCKIEQRGKVYGLLLAPWRKVEMKNDSHFYGSVGAKEIKVENNAQIHHDLSTGFDASGAVLEADIVVKDKLELKQASVVDSFKSSTGAYGGANVGSAARLATNSTGSDKLVVQDNAVLNGSAYGGPGVNPSGPIKVSGSGVITGDQSSLSATILIPSVGDPEITSTHAALSYTNGNTTISTDINCDSLTISGNAMVRIDGAVTIYSRNGILITDNAELRILSGGSLDLIANKKIEIIGTATVNTFAADPHVLVMQQLGGEDIVVGGTGGKLYAQVIAPSARLLVNESGQFYGTFLGNKVTVEGSGKIHADISDRTESGQSSGSASGYTAVWSEQP